MEQRPVRIAIEAFDPPVAFDPGVQAGLDLIRARSQPWPDHLVGVLRTWCRMPDGRWGGLAAYRGPDGMNYCHVIAAEHLEPIDEEAGTAQAPSVDNPQYPQ